MTLQKTLASLAAAGLLMTQPLAAQAAPARAPAPTGQADQLHGGGGAAVTVIGVFAALLLLFWAAGLFHSSSAPLSPKSP